MKIKEVDSNPPNSLIEQFKNARIKNSKITLKRLSQQSDFINFILKFWKQWRYIY